MACQVSYTVVIVPLQSSLHSHEGLHYFLWLRELKALEQEKDQLWFGLQQLDQTSSWYQQRLLHNRTRATGLDHNIWDKKEVSSCLLRCRIQRVNGTLGNLMSDACVWSGTSSADWKHRWRHTLLTQMLSQQNLHISSLQLDTDILESQYT